MNASLVFTITLSVSILGLLAILLIKRYEIRSGRKFMSRVRPGVDSAAVFIVEGVPSLMHQGRHHALSAARQWAGAALMRAVFVFENGLERLLHKVREKTRAPREPGEASPFLREVADHKRELLKRAQSERVIVEE